MSLALPLRTRSDNLRGILAMLAAMGSLIFNDAFLKMAAAELPTGQAIFLRGLFATLLCVGVIVTTVGPGALLHAGSRRVQARAGADVVGTILYLSALMHMPIADATALLQFTPLAITAGAALFLGARVGWRRWLATLVGLIGVLIIVRPGGAGFNAYSLLALSAIGFVAVRDLVTRRIGPEVPTMVVAATSSAAVAAAALALALIETWGMAFPVGPGAPSRGGRRPRRRQLLDHRGHAQRGEIAAVAPFRYSASLWAIAAGLLVWGEVPDLWTWTGIAIVTGAGVYTILRESQLRSGALARVGPLASPAADESDRTKRGAPSP